VIIVILLREKILKMAKIVDIKAKIVTIPN